uniref:Uncharacterized protein n=1 Tax=Romanomermis culicivorax TaxID=13658 RepID=A0A915KGV7_ROMCU
APEHRHVYLNFSKYHDFYYNCTKDFVCRDYLEIRIASDLSLDGFRFCCHGPRIGPMYRALISESNKILIISRIQNPGTTGFYAEYMLTPRPLTPLEATLRNRDEQFREMLRKYIRAKGLDVESMENQLLNHLSKEPTMAYITKSDIRQMVLVYVGFVGCSCLTLGIGAESMDAARSDG